MKHKQDAINKASEVMALHEKINSSLTVDQVERAALVSIEFALDTGLYPAYESVAQRAKNYLCERIFGEEKAKQIHKLEQELGMQYVTLRKFESIAKKEKAEEEIEKMKSQLDELKK